MSDNDPLLIRRVVEEDDRRAFELLVRRYQSGLRNFLRKLTDNDHASADDLAQETFLKAYRRLHQFKGGARFSTWLYKIGYNTFLSERRKDRLPDHGTAIAETPDAASNAAHDLEMDVARALCKLTHRQQAIFHLHYRKGFSHTEIADILAIPLGTVKSDLLRGRETLKGILSEQGAYRHE